MSLPVRTQFLMQLLQKLASPLMGAVNAHADMESDAHKDAATMAALLSESVKIGIAMSQSMNLKTEDGDSDAIRVALSSLAGGLVADHYRTSGRIPSENDGRRMAKILESVIAFSDNFAPNAEHTARLKTLEGVPPFFDPVQTNIYVINALTPVITAISAFSFGQSETRLLQDVAARLGERAKAICGQTDGMGAMSEIVVIQALAHVYADIHRGQTQTMARGGHEVTVNSMENIWAEFEKRTKMLETLLLSMGGVGIGGGSSSGGVRPKPVAEAPSAPPEQESAPPQQQPAAASGGTPMSFFKKK
jgi:hypothetical protein